MVAAPLIGAAVGLGAGLVPWAAGVGKNTGSVQAYGPGSPGYGTPGYSGKDWNAYRDAYAGAQGRQGARIDTGLGDQSRGAQYDALGMMREAALGNRPSVAQLQMQQGLDDAVRSQQALASSARGQAALAQAQYNQAANTGAMQQAIAAQQSQLRAQEMAAALAQYGGMATGIRGQDEGRSLAQAQLDQANLSRNDQYQLGMGGLMHGANQASIQAGLGMQGIQAGSYDRAQAANAAIAGQNAANEWEWYKAAMGGLQGGAQMGMGFGGGGGGAPMPGPAPAPAPAGGGGGLGGMSGVGGGGAGAPGRGWF